MVLNKQEYNCPVTSLLDVIQLFESEITVLHMKYHLILLTAIILLGFLLRFVAVSNNPPGLYIDEASIGYNAYTILTTGKDEYGKSYPLWFQSFGDYKMPVYIYSVSAAMSFLGKTEFAIRFPSVLTGTLTILVFYLFLQKILSIETDKKIREKLKYLPLLASFLLAISSWHIHFSRGGFEITEGTLFFLLGCYLYILFVEGKKLPFTIMSIFFFILAIYTYHTFRILSPLALFYIIYDQKIYKNSKSLSLILGTIILLLPIMLFSLSSNGSERFFATSAFSQIATTNLWQKLTLYPLIYINNYLSFFSFDFLFNFGDGIGRHQIPNFGELYRWQVPFFLAGIYFLLKQKKSKIKHATFLLFLSIPIAGALVVPSPHALRSLPLVIPCIITVAIGILYIIQNLHRFRTILIAIIGIIAIYEFSFYLHFYYIHYPKVNQLDWGAGYKQLVLTTAQQKTYKHIVIDNTLELLKFAPVYFHFYEPSLNITMISPSWKKPKSWGNDSILYIRPYYGQKQNENLIKNIYLTNPNNDIFAQLWNGK